jgi:altronate hydrolase
MSQEILLIDPKDNVAVALRSQGKGTVVKVKNQTIRLSETIEAKHKFTLEDLEVGDNIYMYGVLIGRAIRPIKKGVAINMENTKHAVENYQTKKTEYAWTPPDISKFQNIGFKGYHRANGKVGTRNHWLVIPLVFCENRNLDIIEAALLEKLGYTTKHDLSVNIDELIAGYKDGKSSRDLLQTKITSNREELTKKRLFPNVDGIKFLKHEGGCGGTRDDAETLCKLLAGYIANANVAGATVLSLGCQHAQIEILQSALNSIERESTKPVVFLEQHQSESEAAFIEDSIKQTFLGLIEANKILRKDAPLSKLSLGLECGASDGFSGISANPALGYASDLLVALGGTAVLSEFPELNGVEQELMNRCTKVENANKFAEIMNSYNRKAESLGSGFEFNPCPGNIKDGLITDGIKSAGAAKKGGTSPVTDVLNYGEIISNPGLNLLCTPGNDVESTTGMAGSGCNIIVFTTGLGTPTGNPIAPVIKVSTNTELYNKMGDIIDINAGTIISFEDNVQSMGEKILEYIIRTANGETTKAENLGNNDFIPWKRGVSL